jgi:neutral amino acid transport system substrate-binding protein
MTGNSPRGCFLAILVVLGWAGCQARTVPNLGPDTPRPDTLKIGIVTVTGAGPWGSQPMLDLLAADLAVSDINAAGGVLGRNVELLVGDFSSDPTQIGTVTEDLIKKQGAVGLLASETSDTTLAAFQVAQALNIPQISCCATADDLQAGDTKNLLFRTAPPDKDEANALVVVGKRNVTAAAADGVRRGALIYIENSYGTSLRDAVQAKIAASTPQDFKLIASIGLPEFPTDAQVVDAIAQINTAEQDQGEVDFIMVTVYEEPGAELVSSWYRVTSNRKVFWLLSDGLYGPNFLQLVGNSDPQAFDSLLGTATAVLPDSRNYVYFSQLYHSTYAVDSQGFAAHQYDAVVLLLLAIQAAGTTDGDAVSKHLLRVSRDDSGSDPIFRPDQLADALQAVASGTDINYDGVSGNVDFDDSGDVSGAGYAIFKVVPDGASYTYQITGYLAASDLAE